jgi:alkaline phosphatase D
LIAVVCKSGAQIPNPKVHYFRMRREYDRTGTFHLGEEKGLTDKTKASSLNSNTLYQVKMATLTLANPFPNDEIVPSNKLANKLPDPQVWIDDLINLPDEDSSAEFCTFPAQGNTAPTLNFILGSCRYPGLLWGVKQSDGIFRPISQEVSEGKNGPVPNFYLWWVIRSTLIC